MSIQNALNAKIYLNVLSVHRGLDGRYCLYLNLSMLNATFHIKFAYVICTIGYHLTVHMITCLKKSINLTFYDDPDDMYFIINTNNIRMNMRILVRIGNWRWGDN
ncbi:DNA-directed RNA polymerase subunit beta, partial [Bienertia sinuspersici]